MHNLAIKRANISIINILVFLFFTSLFVVSSYVRIPLIFSPVPITFQTFVLFLSLAVLKRRSVVPYLSYIFLGVSGLPVFANGGSGILYLFGPTGGYLFGFFLSAVIFGYIIAKVSYFKKLKVIDYALIFIFANLLIYLCGVSWLVFAYNVSLENALKIGVAPFILGDILKIILASLFSYKLIKC